MALHVCISRLYDLSGLDASQINNSINYSDNDIKQLLFSRKITFLEYI